MRFRQHHARGWPRAKVQRYVIDIDQQAIDDLRLRLARTRWPDELPATGWAGGTDLAYLKQLTGYWLDEFDWNPARRTVRPAEVVIFDEVNGIGIVLARQLPWNNFGFKMTPAEAKLIAAIAVKKSEGRLSVAAMRKALEPLAAGSAS